MADRQATQFAGAESRRGGALEEHPYGPGGRDAQKESSQKGYPGMSRAGMEQWPHHLQAHAPQPQPAPPQLYAQQSASYTSEDYDAGLSSGQEIAQQSFRERSRRQPESQVGCLVIPFE